MLSIKALLYILHTISSNQNCNFYNSLSNINYLVFCHAILLMFSSLYIVPAVILTSPQTQNVTAGESFVLSCTATGDPVPSIEWRQNGTSYTIRDPSVITITSTDGLRSNSSVINVTNAIASDTGLYQCIATNVVGNDMQDATVVVQG